MLDLLFPRPLVPTLTLNPFTEGTQALRNRGLEHVDVIYAGCPYNAAEVKQAIHLFKYRRVPSLCPVLSRLITEAHFPFDTEAVLCPVPLHWTRQFWRGFNQAQLLATTVSSACELPVQCLLKRTRPTGHQAHRSRAERLVAVRGAFRLASDTLPETVILVDDLATTGATLDACAKELKDAGVETVEGWVVARG